VGIHNASHHTYLCVWIETTTPEYELIKSVHSKYTQSIRLKAVICTTNRAFKCKDNLPIASPILTWFRLLRVGLHWFPLHPRRGYWLPSIVLLYFQEVLLGMASNLNDRLGAHKSLNSFPISTKSAKFNVRINNRQTGAFFGWCPACHDAKQLASSPNYSSTGRKQESIKSKSLWRHSLHSQTYCYSFRRG
jgi:hypothetical protein